MRTKQEMLGTNGEKRETTVEDYSVESGIAYKEEYGEESLETLTTIGCTASDPVKDYLKNIGRFQLLTMEEEISLGKRIVAGKEATTKLENTPKDYGKKSLLELEWAVRDGEMARQTMVEANLRLVVNIAKKYQNNGLTLLELIQEGNIGLMTAVDKYDYTRGNKFSTMAVWWIRQNISRALANQGRSIRIPSYVVDMMNKMARVEREMLVEFGLEATLQELAEALEIPVEKVREIQQYSKPVMSLNTPLGEANDEVELGDILIDKKSASVFDEVAENCLQEQVSKLLGSLSTRERTVVMMRFGLNSEGVVYTLDQAGNALGVTRERARQIELQAMKKLRHPARAKELSAFFD